MNKLLSTEFGSKVYGTSVPTSDTDYKEIFIPDYKDLILQRAPKTIVIGTKEDKTERNTANDIDIEQFSLQQYLKLLMEGQTVALDMLFTPDSWVLETSTTWGIIKREKMKFLHRGTTSFVGYARTQAAKYGIKGSRVNAMRTILEHLKSQKDYLKLRDSEVLVGLFDLIYLDPENKNGLKNENIKFVDCKGPKGIPEPHLEVCNRKMPLHATVKHTVSVFQKIFDEYGARALLAEQNNGVDWKALMHAVRVSEQAKELLTTAHITFPRPEAGVLLQIRKGELPYKQVAEMIENGLDELEKVKLTSILPDQPDFEFADELVYWTTRKYYL